MESSEGKIINWLIDYLSPIQLVVIIASFVFVIELFLMVSLHSVFPHISATAGVLLDSILLVVLLSPLLYFFLFRPITLHINKSTSIDEERARLSAILEMTTDFVGTADTEGRLLYYNRAARKMMGIGEDEDISNIRIPDHHPDWANKIVLGEGIPAAIREGAWRGETALLSRDGREIQVSQVIMAHKAPDGTVEFFSTIIRDISEQKLAEVALRESESGLENAQRIAHIGSWEWNIEKNELYWSDEIYRIFGLIPQEFGANYEAFLNSVHAADREFVKKSVNEAVYRNIPYSIDHRIVLPNGSERMVHEQAEVIFDALVKTIPLQNEQQN